MRERVFLTGATGCVGQYVLEALVESGCYEVHALVRPTSTLAVPPAGAGLVVQHAGSMESINEHAETIRRCDVVIHVATAWDDSSKADEINVDRTLNLASACDPGRCRIFVAFSTASILDANNALLDERDVQATGYIRSKHRACRELERSSIRDRLVLLCPTLVLAGGATHRRSHVVREMAAHRRLLGLARFFRADGRFHFIHARDLASLALRVVTSSTPPARIVAGQRAVEVDEALVSLGRTLGVRHLGWVTLTPARVMEVCRLLGVQLSPWDRRCVARPGLRAPRDITGRPRRVVAVSDVGARPPGRVFSVLSPRDPATGSHPVFVAGEPDNRRRGRALVRPYEARDRVAVRLIRCATAYRNAGARAVFGNEEALADYWTSYYTDVEPGLSYVAVLDDDIVGYLFGCFDARRHVRVMATRIVPSVVRQAAMDLLSGRHKDSALRRYLRWAALWSWRETLPVPVAAFPAHYHVNVLAAGQHQRLYSRLSLAFIDGLEARGGSNVHGLLTERQHGGPFGRFVRRFSAAHPDARILSFERPTRFGRDVLGIDSPMVNRAFCFTGHDFRRIMRWVGDRYGG